MCFALMKKPFWSCKAKNQVWKEYWAHPSSGLDPSFQTLYLWPPILPPPPLILIVMHPAWVYCYQPRPCWQVTLACPGPWALGLTCVVTSLLGPGMYSELTAALSSATEIWLPLIFIPLLSPVPISNLLRLCTLRALSSFPLVWLLPAFLSVRLFLENPCHVTVILELHFEIVSRGFASRGHGVLRLAVKQTCHIDFLLCQKLKKQE